MSRRSSLCLRLCVPDQWSSVSLSILCSVEVIHCTFSLYGSLSDQRSSSATLSVLLHIRLLVLHVVIFLPCISFPTFPFGLFPSHTVSISITCSSTDWSQLKSGFVSTGFLPSSLLMCGGLIWPAVAELWILFLCPGTLLMMARAPVAVPRPVEIICQPCGFHVDLVLESP